MEGGSSVCTIFGPATVIGNEHSIGAAVTFGPNSNVQGGHMVIDKPILNTNQKCSTTVDGDSPPEIKDFCWSMKKEDDTQVVSGNRAG